MTMTFTRTAVALVVASLAACGGGGSSSSGPANNPTPEPEPTAEGQWYGVEDGGLEFDMVIKNDGEFWLIYGDSSGIYGFMQGNGSADGNQFTSTNVRDYDFTFSVAYEAAVEAQFVEGESFNGTLTYDNFNEQTSFTSVYVDAYELEPDLSTLSGTYDGEVAGTGGFELATTVIVDTGELSGLTSSGCAYEGTIAPNSHGNIYDVTITFQGGPCLAGTETVDGVAYYDAGYIYAGVVTGSRDDGFMLLGQQR